LNKGKKTSTKPFRLVAPVPKEDDEQAALARWLDLRRVRWCHVPNGGDRDIRVAARLKSHGVKRGVPDVLIFDPPPNIPGIVGVAVELKRRSGGVVSMEQKDWLGHLENAGWAVKIARGFEDAILYLKGLGY
jgi:hypothetical protein